MAVSAHRPATLEDMRRVDAAIYAAIAATPTPELDVALRRLSGAANYSRLWIVTAGAIAIAGGSRGRRAAAVGLTSLGVTQAVVNLGLKPLSVRRRPDREADAVPLIRHVPMPKSSSWPSGHSAAGFAFATAVGRTLPHVGAPLRLLAAAVAYSRVHTGVHFPGDVVSGALLGGALGQGVANVMEKRIA